MGVQKVTVNPFARVERVEDASGLQAFRILSPRPGRALCENVINSDDPAFRAVDSLHKATSDGRHAISRADLPVLCGLGLLVDADSISPRPTFRPYLSATADIGTSAERVTLTINGELKTASEITSAEAGDIIRCLAEPDQAIWHRLPGGSYMPYFISDEMIDDVHSLAASSQVYASEHHARSLIACGFAADSGETKSPDASKTLSSRHWTRLRPLPTILVEAALEYYDMSIAGGFCRFGSGIKRHYLNDDPVGRALQNYYLQDVQCQASAPIKRLSTYFSGYRDEAVLHSHLDPEEYEIAVSIMLRYDAPAGESNFRWPLALDNGQGIVDVFQEVGEAVAFLSRKTPHSRPPLPKGHECDVLLLHYTRAEPIIP